MNWDAIGAVAETIEGILGKQNGDFRPEVQSAGRVIRRLFFDTQSRVV